MNQIKIKVKDKNGNYNNWLVYEETTNTYRIHAENNKGFITEIYKSKLYYIDNILYSSEIKSPFSTIVPDRYMKAEFKEIWLKKNEY